MKARCRFFPFLCQVVILPILMGEGGRMAVGQEGDASAQALVQANADRFAEAFNRGDAKAVAEFWAEGGIWSDPAADVRIEGREALEKSYGEAFESRPGSRLQLEVESVRVVSSELAIEEGSRPHCDSRRAAFGECLHGDSSKNR